MFTNIPFSYENIHLNSDDVYSSMDMTCKCYNRELEKNIKILNKLVMVINGN